MPERIQLLIVEDEPMIAQDLADRVEDMGYIVTAIVDNGPDALRSIEAQPPDLVLLDINLRGDWDGIDTAERINAMNGPPFVYLTALSDNRTLDRAKMTRPAGYLVKPYHTRRIKIAVELAVFDAGAHEPSEKDFVYGLRHGYVFLKWKGQHRKIILHDLLWLEADGNYSVMVTTKGKLVQTISMGQLQEKLAYPPLVRVHRGYAVNIDHISRFEETRLFVHDAEIPLGRSYRAELLRRLRTL